MKLFFTDLDGTLLNSECKISEATKATLDKWVAAGNKLILNSGRPLDSILEVKRLGGLNYPGMLIVANNGSLIYDCDSSTVLHSFHIRYECLCKFDSGRHVFLLQPLYTKHVRRGCQNYAKPLNCHSRR